MLYVTTFFIYLHKTLKTYFRIDNLTFIRYFTKAAIWEMNTSEIWVICY